MKRVVVTGLGLITALGTGLEKSWAGIISGKTGIKTIESFDTEDTPVKVAGEVRDFQPEEFGIEKKEIKKLARNTQFAIGAAKMALSDSGLTIDENNAERVGVIISSGIGGMEIFEAQHEVLLNKGPKRLSPFTIPGMIANMASGNVGIYLGAKGPNKSIVTACAAGTHSIGDAFETIKLGKAVIISSGIGGMEIFEAQHEVLLNKGPKRVSPFTIPGMIANMASGNVGIYLGAKGPNKSIVTACAAGTHSIGDAFETIKLGKADVMFAGGTEACITKFAVNSFAKADVMFAGGTEACITKFAVNSFANMKALSTNPDPNTASRPFTIDRDGFVMGEGAGVLVLEELEHALARNAKIYAEVVGYGETCDAHHITAPAVDGAVRAFKMALEESGASVSEVDYINAHGTSTGLNDKNETAAIKEVFGEDARRLNISSTKGATGHVLGGAGGIEGVILAKSIAEEIIPPTANYENPDPECDLNYTPNKAEEKEIRVGMSSSLGFGGHNAVIVMKKYK